MRYEINMNYATQGYRVSEKGYNFYWFKVGTRKIVAGIELRENDYEIRIADKCFVFNKDVLITKEWLKGLLKK